MQHRLYQSAETRNLISNNERFCYINKTVERSNKNISESEWLIAAPVFIPSIVLGIDYFTAYFQSQSSIKGELAQDHSRVILSLCSLC